MTALNTDFLSSKIFRLAILIGIVAYALLLFHRGLVDADEGRYAEIPREMVVNGTWPEMRLLGFRYYEKPPLTYWASALSMHLLGVSDAAARAPLLVCMLGTLMAVGALVVRHWPRATWTPAMLVTATAGGLFIGMAFLVTDDVLTVWFTVACALLYEAYRRDATRRMQWVGALGAAVAVFMGTLAKGLVAIVLPGAILFFWLVWERRWLHLFRGPTWAAGILFAALLAPTLFWIESHNPDFFRLFFVEEHFSRFTGTRAIQGREESFFYFFLVLPGFLLPWAFFLPRLIRQTHRQQALRTDELTRFLTVWVGVVFLFFSASSGKLPPYIMPALPPMAMLMGRWALAPAPDGSTIDHRLYHWPWRLFLVLPLVLLGAWIVAWLKIFPHFLYRPRLITLLPVLATLIVGALAWRATRRQSTAAPAPWFVLILTTSFLSVAVLMSPWAGGDFTAHFRCSSEIFSRLHRELGPDDHIVMYDDYRPSLTFYAPRPIWMYLGRDELTMGMDMELREFLLREGPEPMRDALRTKPISTKYTLEEVLVGGGLCSRDQYLTALSKVTESFPVRFLPTFDSLIRTAHRIGGRWLMLIYEEGWAETLTQAGVPHHPVPVYSDGEVVLIELKYARTP